MSVLDGPLEFFGFAPTKATALARRESEVQTRESAVMQYGREVTMMALSIALEDRDYIPISGVQGDVNQHNLSFKATKKAAREGRALVAGSPLASSAFVHKSALMFAHEPIVTKGGSVTEDPKNKRTVFSLDALLEMLKTKSGEGNLFYRLNKGRGTATAVPFAEINGAIYDPNEPGLIRYFLREWDEKAWDFELERETTVHRKRFYVNLQYLKEGGTREIFFGDIPVDPFEVIYHKGANKAHGQAWGYPDILAGIFYSAEFRELVAAGDSIYRAQSQFAVTYQSKSQKNLEAVAASIVAPSAPDFLSEGNEYGGSLGLPGDVEMKLMSSIGGGIDFTAFDRIASLASSVLGVPLNIVMGEEKGGGSFPPTTIMLMQKEQSWIADVLRDVAEYLGKPNLKVWWPPIDPDPTHRQIQSIAGAATMKIASPKEIRGLIIDTFGVDWSEAVPDPDEWEPFSAAPVQTAAPGSTEPSGGAITPGQGQTGRLGKLADGDHSLRDEGDQDHTKK